MRTRSARWDTAISGSHTLVSRVGLLLAGEPVDGMDDLAVSRADISLDRRAKVRGRLTVDFADSRILPRRSGDLCTPFGYELAVWRGVRHTDGSIEEMPLGVYPIQETAARIPDRITSATCLDRAQWVRDAGMGDSLTITAGTNYGTAIASLITSRVPWVTLRFAATPYTTPLITIERGDDPWDVAVGMARSIGYDLYFDGAGDCVLAPSPELDTVPVWSLSGVVSQIDTQMDRYSAYSVVIARSSNLTSVDEYVATVEDLDVSSPTYVGRFGRKIRHYASPFIASSTQAESAARAVLRTVSRPASEVRAVCAPNPALELGDTVEIDDGSLMIIESMSIGVEAASSMVLGLRA